MELTQRLLESNAFRAWLLMFLVGPLVEALFRARAARADRLNWAYAPIFLIVQIGLTGLAFAAFAGLREHLGLAPLWELPAFTLPIPGGEGIGDLLSLALFMFVLDGSLYWMHRFQHRVPVLWIGHRMHHSDPAVDVTTAVRLHALDLVLSALFVALPFTFVFSIPALHNPGLLVLPFLVTYYIHLNVNIDHGRLWWLFASPNYHLRHHRLGARHDVNLAAFFPIWDLLFGTARRPEANPHIAVGLNDWRPATLRELIARPLGELLRRGRM